eukprot:g47266.t1
MDGSGMVGEHNGDPIAVAVGKTGGKGQTAGDGLDLVQGPADNGAGESLVEEGGHFGGSLVEDGIIRTDSTEMEKLGECSRVFTGGR